MPIPYSPLAAANFFIENFGSKAGIEHMKLQKLVYCSHGWWIAFHDAPFLNERPQVWRHGPVFYSLYHVLKVFGRNPITQSQSSNPFAPPDQIDDNDSDVIGVLTWVWQRYGHLSSFALSDMTHKPGTPWSRVALENDYSVPHGTEIPDSYIKEEFQRIYKEEIVRTQTFSAAPNEKRQYAPRN